MNDETQYDNFDPFSDELRCDTMAELKDAAFEYRPNKAIHAQHPSINYAL